MALYFIIHCLYCSIKFLDFLKKGQDINRFNPVLEVSTSGHAKLEISVQISLCFVLRASELVTVKSANMKLVCPLKMLLLLLKITVTYRNDPKFSDTPKMCCNHSKV